MLYNKLKVFTNVAELGSVTGAATKLRRTQSAVTQQLQLLEEELGLKLLERRNARIFLSRDGEVLYRLAKQKLGELDDGIFSVQEKLNAAEGRIQLGVLNDHGNEFKIGETLGRFCKTHPEIAFDLVEAPSRELEAMMLENKLDMAFTVFFSQPEMFIRKSMGKTFHSIYSNPHYLKDRRITNYKQLLDDKLIDITATFACFSTWFRKNCDSLLPALLHRVPDIVAPNFLVVRQILQTGFGVGILPNYLTVDDLENGALVKVMATGKQIFAGVDLAYRTNKTLRLCEKLLIEFAVKNARYGEG